VKVEMVIINPAISHFKEDLFFMIRCLMNSIQICFHSCIEIIVPESLTNLLT
jgi:hypothetical protein